MRSRSYVRRHYRKGRPVRGHYRRRTGRKRKINRNFYLNKDANLYVGVNAKVGPYCGLNYRPTKDIKINPRANLRYGPSANAEYKITKKVKASASVSPTNADVNVNAKVGKNTQIGVGANNLGPYCEVKRKSAGLKYLLRK